MRWFLLLIPMTSLAGEAEFIKQWKTAKELIHAIYLSEDAERFCRENPDDVYMVNFEGHEIEFSCKQRNAWVDHVASK